jgi:hypothetical protein
MTVAARILAGKVTKAGPAQSVIRSRRDDAEAEQDPRPGETSAARSVQLIARGAAQRGGRGSVHHGFNGSAPPSRAVECASTRSLFHRPEQGGGQSAGPRGAAFVRATPHVFGS